MKNTSSKLILSVFLSIALLSFAYGQNKAHKERADKLIETRELITVKGTVTAFNNYYVKNAEITSRKTRIKAFTDSLGMFDIRVARGDVLVFNANGFEKNRRKLSENEHDITVDMILVPGVKNEKLVVDFGHMNEKDLVYALEHHNIINNDFPGYHDMGELLQASLLGTRVIDQSGSIQVYVRGRDISSVGFSENNCAATFALDGMIVQDVDNLNPRDVKSIRLLTGHEASRMFGSQGANGVVLIKTK